MFADLVILTTVDYVILALYFAFVLGTGCILKKRVSTSEDFLPSTRSVPGSAPLRLLRQVL